MPFVASGNRVCIIRVWRGYAKPRVVAHGLGSTVMLDGVCGSAPCARNCRKIVRRQTGSHNSTDWHQRVTQLLHRAGSPFVQACRLLGGLPQGEITVRAGAHPVGDRSSCEAAPVAKQLHGVPVLCMSPPCGRPAYSTQHPCQPVKPLIKGNTWAIAKIAFGSADVVPVRCRQLLSEEAGQWRFTAQ